MECTMAGLKVPSWIIDTEIDDGKKWRLIFFQFVVIHLSSSTVTTKRGNEGAQYAIYKDCPQVHSTKLAMLLRPEPIHGNGMS
jgi:hypothetical protein